ncbi:MAG: DUF3460 family protein [Candidatus Protistobacter heckmanni]|nr:DUF3460 family protein [Candidatus Protistobacter heckmanni]MCS6766701.1 DUF3460 family protein [Candidatus Protistobacter heckmanni]
MALYQSDITRFLNTLKQQPEIERGQREGRALLWDKAPVDLDERQALQQTRVKQRGYVYQGN